MFGLMKGGPRLPYCGMCKSLGAIYGPRARFLLNHDIAFLAEVLLDLGEVPLAAPAYGSFNCLTLPRRQEDIPDVLQYTAAITVVLAYFRLADHRRDTTKRSPNWRWKLATQALSRPYRRAAEHLGACGFPLEEMCAVLASQPDREAHPRSLAEVAEPTMTATALVFSHGVRLAGRPDRADAAWRLGHKFGELIYLLDAYEDRERDARTGNFNPLLALPRERAATSPRDEILSIVTGLEREMHPAHSARLRGNVEERLGLRPRVLQTACRQPLRERVREAVAFARRLRDRAKPGLFQGAAIMAGVAAVSFLFPAYARRTESWQQCLGVSMNLMALSAIFAGPPNPEEFPSGMPGIPGVSDGSCRAAVCGPCKDTCIEGCVEGICDMLAGN